MKKKLLALVMVTGLVLASFAACGDDSSDNGGGDKKTDKIISEAEATKIALDDAGVKEKDAKNLYAKLETDDGVQEYDIEFIAENKEFDYTIEATTGNILEKDNEVEHAEPVKDDKTSNKISEKKAIDLALAKVKGNGAKDVTINLETDDGKAVYEGQIICDNVEYDFEIDAETGEFIEWSEESVDED